MRHIFNFDLRYINILAVISRSFNKIALMNGVQECTNFYQNDCGLPEEDAVKGLIWKTKVNNT